MKYNILTRYLFHHCKSKNINLFTCRHYSLASSSQDSSKQSKSKEYNYLEDSKAINLLIDAVTHDINKDDGIIEWFPGTGKVTEKLLNNTKTNKFLLFEPNANNFDLLNSALMQHPASDRVVLSNTDSSTIQAVITPSSLRKNPLSRKLKLHSSLLRETFGDTNRTIRIIAPVLSTRICHKIVRDYGLCQNSHYGGFHPIYYFYVHSETYKNIVEKRLMELYFDIEPQASLMFVPKTVYTKYPQNYQLIKATPNTQIMGLFQEEEFVRFYYFARNLMYKKSDMPVIEWLESYIPDVGPHFIKKGLKTFVTAPKLPNDEFLQLYKDFISHPLYKNCAYPHAVKLEIFGHIFEKD